MVTLVVGAARPRTTIAAVNVSATPRTTRSRSALLSGALVILALGLPACQAVSLQFGGLDTDTLEQEILTNLQSELPVQLDSVDCPAGVEPKAGDVFVCRVAAADGSVGTVEVQQVDDSGNVTWELTEVSAPDEQ